MVMKVSTIRELMIFSKLVCELSLGAGGIAVEDSPVENIELAKWTLLDDVIELVLWRSPAETVSSVMNSTAGYSWKS